MKQTLSLCMIVKNEQKYLRDCLQSVYKIVDQIIIVDTGSHDKTIEIAKEFGAEIHHFKWVDDFSAARNESIKYASGDWILWMDADERLMPVSIPELKKILKPETKPVIYRIQINSIVNQGESTRLSSAHRLFTNNRGLYFSGKIHEQISESAAAVGGEERQSNIIIEHLGYNLDKVGQSEKDKRNTKLLEKAVESNPQNAYAHFTLAQQYGMMHEWNRALKHYELAEKLNQFDTAMTASLLNTKAEALFNLGKYDRAKQSCRHSIQKEILQVGAYYMLYRIAEVEQNPAECIKQLEKVLENSRALQNHVKTISTDVLIGEERILYTMALNYLKLDQSNDAVKKLNEALEINPDKSQIRDKLLENYLKNQNWEEAVFHLQYLMQQYPQQEKYADLLGTIFIKQQQFHQAIKIYESTILKNPQNKDAVKKLVGLYGKTGELEKANKLMQMIT